MNFDGTIESTTSCTCLEPTFEENLCETVLTSYILGVIKCCDFIRQELQKGNVYEEEDVSTNTAALTLLENIDVSQFLELLNHALEIISQGTVTDVNPRLSEAIKVRLIFRKTFLVLVSGTLTSTQDRCQALEQCLHLLPSVTTTIDLGKALPQAFSTRIQRKVSTQVPPRPMVTIDPKEAVSSWKSLLETLVQFEDLYNYTTPYEIWVISFLGGVIDNNRISLTISRLATQLRSLIFALYYRCVLVTAQAHLDLLYRWRSHPCSR